MQVLMGLLLGAGLTFGEPQFVTATWYGGSDGYHGQLTASGETFDKRGMTAASPRLRLGTMLAVCSDGKCVVVRVNDRMPDQWPNWLDLSEAAFEKLAPLSRGRLNAMAVEVRR